MKLYEIIKNYLNPSSTGNYDVKLVPANSYSEFSGSTGKPSFKEQVFHFPDESSRNDFLKQYAVGSENPIQCKLGYFAGSADYFPVISDVIKKEDSVDTVLLGLTVLPKNDAHKYSF